jgi:hypothetical protein
MVLSHRFQQQRAAVVVAVDDEILVVEEEEGVAELGQVLDHNDMETFVAGCKVKISSILRTQKTTTTRRMFLLQRSLSSKTS